MPNMLFNASMPELPDEVHKKILGKMGESKNLAFIRKKVAQEIQYFKQNSSMRYSKEGWDSFMTKYPVAVGKGVDLVKYKDLPKFAKRNFDKDPDVYYFYSWRKEVNKKNQDKLLANQRANIKLAQQHIRDAMPKSKPAPKKVATHTMAGGKVMTGKTHTKQSKPVAKKKPTEAELVKFKSISKQKKEKTDRRKVFLKEGQKDAVADYRKSELKKVARAKLLRGDAIKSEKREKLKKGK